MNLRMLKMKLPLRTFVIVVLTPVIAACGHDGCPGDERGRSVPADKRVVDRRPRWSDNSTLREVVGDLCLRQRTDRLVYRKQNDTNVFIGFDDVQGGVVYTMMWTMAGPYGETLEDENMNKGGFDLYPAAPFRETLTLDALLAATDRRQQMKFLSLLDVCRSTRLLTRTCLIHAFATASRDMKALKLHKTCSKH
ncbi:uncharacterized protein LOC128231987 [Mya arenaria]|uniref:uncharacterized protein LOC128231987 n=1 Tax=Mya arenaria TaxID=6604 RepID=UPI0022E8CFA6|nr:uncharacterized protein LOC128231987 [Mya arenaria]